MIALDAERTRALLPFDRLIEALRRTFVTGCHVPPRHSHAVQVAPDKAGTLLLMPAWSQSGYLGVKTVCIYPANGAAGLPGVHATYTLYDAASGVPLAQVDGSELTARRTAAASALAASYLARSQAQALAIVGAGRIAAVLAHAYRAVRPIRRVRVWNRNATRARLLVERLSADGFEAALATDLEQAVRASDIVTCATLSTQPLVRGQWLQPGQHLDLIGAFAPHMRETDDECFRDTSVFVDCAEAPLKAGDLVFPLASGALAPSGIRARLEDLCRGRHPGRANAHEITVFKSVGNALEDLAAGMLAYEGAAGSADR